VDELVPIIRRETICTAIIAVPDQAAQQTADLLVEGGISGILNFAPTRIHVPAGIYVDNIDLTTSVEKVAYFANKKFKEKE
jgi:redox-sensing transcriptional repressor